MSRAEKPSSTSDVWRAVIKRQESAHAVIRQADKLPNSYGCQSVSWSGRRPSAFLDEDSATVVCERIIIPITAVRFGCQGRGVIDGAVRGLCPTCGGVGRLLSARGLKEATARLDEAGPELPPHARDVVTVLSGERLSDATDEAIEKFNQRLAATDNAFNERAKQEGGR